MEVYYIYRLVLFSFQYISYFYMQCREDFSLRKIKSQNISWPANAGFWLAHAMLLLGTIDAFYVLFIWNRALIKIKTIPSNVVLRHLSNSITFIKKYQRLHTLKVRLVSTLHGLCRFFMTQFPRHCIYKHPMNRNKNGMEWKIKQIYIRSCHLLLRFAFLKGKDLIKINNASTVESTTTAKLWLSNQLLKARKKHQGIVDFCNILVS